MTSRSKRPAAWYVGLAALGAVLFVGAPTTGTATASDEACVTTVDAPADARVRPGQEHTSHDTADLNAVERARTKAEITRKVSASRMAASIDDLPANILVPVYVHIIQGSHERERTVSRQKARNTVALLRNGFRGTQSGYSASTRYSFTVKSITVTRNDKWYHAGMNSAADQQMKRSLHRGFSRALNLYINAPGGNQGLLGYARFPWQYAGNPTMDGVTVHAESLPGGSFGGFNLGDTVIHEVGHWLGLFHTFQSSKPNGCNDLVNDSVADTPRQAEPNGRRPNGLCDNPVLVCDLTDLTIEGLRDPVFNFMDYSSDRCMREFTAGQSLRMDYAYAAYRH